ncbi:hypothetical protein K2173_001393 [Erythroxylum novogranatense]|uniref:S-adenosylmethionine-dependent methyltransferase At5g38100 n=1 Tax=Erythroxylum novogranatense TaxID=1862640 RepID=A0AAV8T3K0_9ROSI|nr:hypothetical protein K2173_001393 [Erythroxylum novogranatense]
MASLEHTLIEARPMTGGDGPLSYAKNSPFQKGVVERGKLMIIEGIKNKLDFKIFDTSNKFLIADFGCSAGPNTFFGVENIIEAVGIKYRAQNKDSPPLEFQVFFNDLTDNDFNTLFRTLPSYQKYFAAGVPGSFHVRLFPKSSLHIGFSSCALLWLSKIPREVLDCKSPAWNKGSIIQCNEHSEEVAKAFLGQYASDVDTFLTARAQEIVGEGLMVIQSPGRPDGVLMSQTSTGITFNLFGSCLADLSKMGVIAKEKVDSFNLPLYFATVKELEKIIKKNGYFSIEKLEVWDHPMFRAMKLDPQARCVQFRTVSEGLVKMHFGDNTVEEIFNYYVKKLEENYSAYDKASNHQIEMFILLKLKIN